MESARLNLPNTCAVTIDLLGHQLQFSQDPNSKHLGTTVWDASMVFAKYLEKSSRKGRFCPSKLKGKRAIELGAGCGVAGFAMAMLGCDVVTTDQKEVLPLLQRNVERNTSIIMQTNLNSDVFGSVRVAELDWDNINHIKSVDPPYDFVIGTDVVYAEHLLDPLLQTILHLSGPRTTIMMDYKYQHPSIQLYMMGLKPSGVGIAPATSRASNQVSETVQKESKQSEGENSGTDEFCVVGETKDCSVAIGLPGRGLSDWELRRYGAMAARLLHDVKID